MLLPTPNSEEALLVYHTQREAEVARDAVRKALDPATLLEVTDDP